MKKSTPSAATSRLPCGKPSPSLPSSGVEPSDWKGRLDSYLKLKALNQSRQRDLIAETILSQGGHQTAQEMVRRVQAQHPSIGAATVYRTVHVLEEAGLLRKTLTDAAGIVLYEASVQESDDHHDHIVCLDCGAIFEFHEPRIEKAQAEVLAQNGFSESRHEHILFARCNDLKRTNKG